MEVLHSKKSEFLPVGTRQDTSKLQERQRPQDFIRRALPTCLCAYGQVTGAPAWPKLLFRIVKSRIPVTPSLLKSARRSVTLLNVALSTLKSAAPTTLSLSASPPLCTPIS